MRKCCYCKDSIPPQRYIDHIIVCDGTPGSESKLRRQELLLVMLDIDKQIMGLKERRQEIQTQIDDIDNVLPGQIKLEI